MAPKPPPLPATPPGRFGDLSSASIGGDHQAWPPSRRCRCRHRTIDNRRHGVRMILQHLAGCDGATWQERWEAAGLNSRIGRLPACPTTGGHVSCWSPACACCSSGAWSAPASRQSTPTTWPDMPTRSARCKTIRCWIEFFRSRRDQQGRPHRQAGGQVRRHGGHDGVRDLPGRPDARRAALLRHREPASPVRGPAWPARAVRPGTSCT